MKKWFNFETENPSVKNNLRKYLKCNNIKYELSSCFDGWHFEIFVDENRVEDINEFLDFYC